MLNYTTENSVFEAEVGRSGKTYRFIYDGTTKRATLVFSSGTYDEDLYAVEKDYQTARAAMEAGRYEEACALLLKITGYRDVSVILEKDENIRAVAYATPGGIVTFGAYEQDNDANNGAEPIEWIVLSSDGNTSLLISKQTLDSKPYNEGWTSVTWEKCTLRKWLNEEFLNAAFSEEEQAKLETVTVTANEIPRDIISSDPGNNTQDQVYLLSVAEANALFDGDDARKCQPTIYAEAHGAIVEGDGNSCWWLRSPGRYWYDAAYVSNYGVVCRSGKDVNDDSGAVRPVVVLRLS